VDFVTGVPVGAMVAIVEPAALVMSLDARLGEERNARRR